eukprot:117180-Pelagomonas_calceolata.AAC.4
MSSAAEWECPRQPSKPLPKPGEVGGLVVLLVRSNKPCVSNAFSIIMVCQHVKSGMKGHLSKQQYTPSTFVQLVLQDFRSGATKKAAKQRDPKQPIKLVQWNIERGYKLKEVIEELKAIDGDVLSLQEVCVSRPGAQVDQSLNWID